MVIECFRAKAQSNQPKIKLDEGVLYISSLRQERPVNSYRQFIFKAPSERPVTVGQKRQKLFLSDVILDEFKDEFIFERNVKFL